MNTLVLNTHTFIKRLKAANMTEEQAEVIVEGINAARETDLANLATKADLKQEIAALDTKIDKLDTKIDKLETRLYAEITLLKWMSGFTLTAVMAIFYLLLRQH